MVHRLHVDTENHLYDLAEDNFSDILELYSNMYGDEVMVMVYSKLDRRYAEVVPDVLKDKMGLDDNVIKSQFLVEMDYKTLSSDLMVTKVYYFSDASIESYNSTVRKIQNISNQLAETGKIPVLSLVDTIEGHETLTVTAKLFGTRGPYNCYVPMFGCSSGSGSTGSVDSTLDSLTDDTAADGVRRLVGSVDLATRVYTLTKDGRGRFQLPGFVNLNAQSIPVSVTQTKIRKNSFNDYVPNVSSKPIKVVSNTNTYTSQIVQEIDVTSTNIGVVNAVGSITAIYSNSIVSATHPKVVVPINVPIVMIESGINVSSDYPIVIVNVLSYKKFDILTGTVIDTFSDLEVDIVDKKYLTSINTKVLLSANTVNTTKIVTILTDTIYTPIAVTADTSNVVMQVFSKICRYGEVVNLSANSPAVISICSDNVSSIGSYGIIITANTNNVV